jgi:hypothetical protein
VNQAAKNLAKFLGLEIESRNSDSPLDRRFI